MIQFTVTVPFEEGLHARPAAELVNICKNIASEITLAKGETEVNPKSILGLLTLAAGHGENLNVTVDGADEAAVTESLKAFFEK